MSIIVTKSVGVTPPRPMANRIILLSGILLSLLITGCGLKQKVSEGTASVVNGLFYKAITTLHLDFISRATLNTDEDSTPLPMVVRVYQLKDSKAFEQADYQQLLTDGEVVLKADLLASREVVIRPGGTASLDMPLNQEARFVAVMGMFFRPDLQKGNWRLVIKHDELEADKARTLELGPRSLTLLPLKGDR